MLSFKKLLRTLKAYDWRKRIDLAGNIALVILLGVAIVSSLWVLAEYTIEYFD